MLSPGMLVANPANHVQMARTPILRMILLYATYVESEHVSGITCADMR